MRVALVGGSGFVGSHLLPAFLQAGHELRVVGRGVRSAALPPGLAPTRGDVVSGEGLLEAFQGAQAVVNLAAVIRERGVQTFDSVNARGSARVVAAAEAAGVERLVQFSAVGADSDPNFPYLLSKWRGEQAVQASSLDWVIVRSSTIFGPGPGFFSELARAISLPSPFLIVPGDGSATFQPIAAQDVARCLLQAVEQPERSHYLYEIGGPDQLTLDELTLEVARAIDKEWFGISKRKLLHLDPRLIRPGAVLMDKLMPHPLVTPAQLAMLAKPNVTRLDAVPSDFGFDPLPLHGHLDYLRRPRRWPRMAA
ncbi:MAG: NAD-dependent epimerase/dehydratase family protein [Candidatus Dormibacteria bacterium]